MNSRLPIARARVKAGLRFSLLPSPVSVTTARSGARAELAARPRITKRNAARQQDLFVIWNLWAGAGLTGPESQFSGKMVWSPSDQRRTQT